MFSILPPIAEIHAMFRDRRLSPQQLVEFCLAQIANREESLQAWVRLEQESARRQAESHGEAMLRGDSLGPLFGIPIGVKDIVDVAGWPTKAGSPLRSTHSATGDAPIVARLRAAGAIILGKTVTTEFACFDPPPTRNPWNHQHTPGGSSSGSAAAVASGMCVAAIGSQTGGSVIRPAAYCGIVGFKPTHGWTTLNGIVPVSPRLDHLGPLTRNVADARTLFEVLADFLPLPSRQSGERDIKLAMVGGYFEEHASAEVSRLFRGVVDQLRTNGPGVRNFSLPSSFRDVHRMHRRIMARDAARFHFEQFQNHRSQYGPCVASLIEEGLATSDADYLEATNHQEQFRRDMAAVLPNDMILLMPSTNTTAPGIETTGDPRFNSPWSYCGLPEITIPCGLDKHGLPCGLQLVSAACNETALLDTAELCERLLGFNAVPPSH